MAKEHSRAFKIIEFTVIVSMMAIIGFTTMPRLGRGNTVDEDSAVAADLHALRGAVERYAQDHSGVYPGKTSAQVLGQLTRFTDTAGDISPVKDLAHPHGPYMRRIPALAVGENKNKSNITTTGPAGTGAFAWYFDGTTFWANTPDRDIDSNGDPYNRY